MTEDRPSGWLSRSDPDGNLALRPHRGSGGKVRRFALTVLAAVVVITVRGLDRAILRLGDVRRARAIAIVAARPQHGQGCGG